MEVFRSDFNATLVKLLLFDESLQVCLGQFEGVVLENFPILTKLVLRFEVNIKPTGVNCIEVNAVIMIALSVIIIEFCLTINCNSKIYVIQLNFQIM